MQGYVQVYTGNGKGKTTAALGLALRAAGAGLKVYIVQFAKASRYSEIKALDRYEDCIVIEQFGTGRFISGKPAQDDLDAARQGLDAARDAVASGRYDVVVLDEANIATYYGLITADALLGVIDGKLPQVELIITGRYAHAKILERADLVTEMREVKHYYQAGVAARDGIEQ